MNSSLPIEQNTEVASMTSADASAAGCQSETTSENCRPKQHTAQSDVTGGPTDNQAASTSSSSAAAAAETSLTQCSSNETTAGAAFYCHPGTDCYENFGDIIKTANETS